MMAEVKKLRVTQTFKRHKEKLWEPRDLYRRVIIVSAGYNLCKESSQVLVDL